MNSHSEVLEVIDAFVDGERVDPDALKRALADPAGRDYFVSAWALREVVQQDRDTSHEHRAPSAIATSRAAPRWFVAAALVACAAGGGYFAGHRAPPPAASPVVQVATPVVVSPARAVFPAPAPTRVIQLEFHPDSPTTSGGD